MPKHNIPDCIVISKDFLERLKNRYDKRTFEYEMLSELDKHSTPLQPIVEDAANEFRDSFYKNLRNSDYIEQTEIEIP